MRVFSDKTVSITQSFDSGLLEINRGHPLIGQQKCKTHGKHHVKTSFFFKVKKNMASDEDVPFN